MAGKVNFSTLERDLLIQLLDKYPIVMSKKTNVETNAKKDEAWENMAEEFNKVSWVTRRSAKQLKMKYKNMKKDLPRIRRGESVVDEEESKIWYSSPINEKMDGHGAVEEMSNGAVAFIKKEDGPSLTNSNIDDAGVEIDSMPMPSPFDSDVIYDNKMRRMRARISEAITDGAKARKIVVEEEGLQLRLHREEEHIAVQKSIRLKDKLLKEHHDIKMKLLTEEHDVRIGCLREEHQLKIEEHNMKMAVLSAKLNYYQNLSNNEDVNDT